MKTLKLSHLALATALCTGSAIALAGECASGQMSPDGKGMAASSEAAKAVTDMVLTMTDLAKEPSAIQGRLFRARKLEIQPGGIVPWHSHADRPAILFIASGEVTEYASTCKTPIVHKAGDITPERAPTSHWWKNTGAAPVVIYSFDLFRKEDKKDEHMM